MTDINEFPIAGQENNDPEGQLKQVNNNKTSGKKSRKKIVLGLLLVVILIVSVVGISFANKVRQFRHDGPLVFMIEKITEDMDLTAQQKQSIQQIKDEIKAKMESRKKEDHASAMTDFENAFRQDNLDKTTLDAIATKHEADKQEMKSFFEDELIKFHNILTADQRNKVADKMKDFRQNHKDKSNDKDGKKKFDNH